jgi:hypothetical protein
MTPAGAPWSRVGLGGGGAGSINLSPGARLKIFKLMHRPERCSLDPLPPAHGFTKGSPPTTVTFAAVEAGWQSPEFPLVIAH